MHTIVTNLEGSEIVLDYCARFGRRVLVASTSEVYGDHRSTEPLREDARRIYGPTTQKRWLYAGLEGDGRVPRTRLSPGA